MRSDDFDGFADAERIGRYIDGEMDNAERAAFETELASNAALADQLARLTSQDERLRAAYALPVDDALLARLGLSPAAPAAADDSVKSAQLIDLAQARAQRAERAGAMAANSAVLGRWRWAAGAAMAAAVALAVAIPLWPAGQADPTSSQAFQLAMETAPSRTSRPVDGDSVVEPQSTFADRTGRYCRDYVLGGSQSVQGVACRTEAGQWRVESQTSGGERTADNGEIRTAAGDGDGALESVYQRLGASDPFDKQKENSLIAGGWIKPAN